jgi:hypothetical protein
MLSAPAAAGYSVLGHAVADAGGSVAGVVVAAASVGGALGDAGDGSPPPQPVASAATAPSTTAHRRGLCAMFIPVPFRLL